MKVKLLVLSSLSIAIFSSACFSNENESFSTLNSNDKLSTSAIPFIQNKGQKHPDVAFYARTLGGSVFVNTNGELVYSIPKKTEKGIERWAFKEHFMGQGKLSPKSIDTGSLHINYAHAKQNQLVPTANRLSLGQAITGVDIQLQARANNVEKLFVVTPGVDPANIRVELQGINASHLSQAGQLVLETGLGSIAFTKPIAFQMRGKEKQLVQVAYTLKDNQYGFRLGDYDRTREVVIDPLLASTFIGGVNNSGAVTYDYDRVYAVLPAGGYVYAAGLTQSPNFPTALGYDSTYSSLSEGFILRFSGDLKTLLNGTFLGNTVYDLQLNSDGTVIAVGQTNGGFPKTTGAYSYPSSADQSGGFIAKLSVDLTTLIAGGVVVKAPSLTKVSIGNGAIYFGGRTNNTSFDVTPGVVGPTCFCTTNGGFGQAPSDGFIGRISADLSTLEVLSYLSGENVSGIAIAGDSSVYVTDGYYSGLGGSIRRLDADITAVLGSSDFGPTSLTNFYDVVIKNGEVYAAGETKKSDLPSTSGAFDTSCGTDVLCNSTYSDGFIAKYSANLDSIVALSYFGGSENDGIETMAIDDAGSVYVAGETRSADLPMTANAFDATCGSDAKCDKTGPYGIKKEVFIGKFSSDLANLEYASYIGGSHDDFVNDIEIESTGIVLIGGETDWASNFPTTNAAFDTTYNGGASDGYVSKFDTRVNGGGSGGGVGSGGSNIAPTADAGIDQTVAPQSKVSLDGSHSGDSDGNIVAYSWKQVSGKSVTISNANSAIAKFTAPKARRGQAATLVFELSVTDNQGAKGADQVTIMVVP